MPPTTSGLETEWDYSGRDGKARKYMKQVRKGKGKSKRY